MSGLDKITLSPEDFEEVPYLESIAVINDKELVIFAVNRGEEEMNLTVHLSELSSFPSTDFEPQLLQARGVGERTASTTNVFFF
ncbi:hypothetical protein EfmAA610_24630 [Enterococcus faecium]|nr:hypothetical protein EfmAA610_24630 [Enterococcus faecium]